MKRIDMNPEQDMDALAEIAYELAERVRDDDPHVMRAELQRLCVEHPVKAAQVVMVLAVWFDPETTTTELWERVNSVARSRVRAA